VGTHAARLLTEEDATEVPRIVGISDRTGYLYSDEGLPISELMEIQSEHGVAARPYYRRHLDDVCATSTKFSNAPNDLLRESAFCLVPAAPIANYLDVDDDSRPSMTVDRMGSWKMIVEGANTYSPDPARRAARARMERKVYWQSGVLIATDFLVNSGGVIFAAQEQLIETPDHLRIPHSMLGDRAAVDGWLADRQADFAELAEARRLAGEAKRDEVIRRNMKELIDHLAADSDMLPCEAAERISIERIASSESDRTVSDVMASIPTIPEASIVREAAQMLVSENGDILAVVSPSGELAGVVTDWDIARASTTDCPDDMPVAEIMSGEPITAGPADSILDVIRKLEHYDISAMPVVVDREVVGMISSDILAQRTLYRLLQTRN
jgi:glutamate dehydrogenase (NAD(P)+)